MRIVISFSKNEEYLLNPLRENYPEYLREIDVDSSFDGTVILQAIIDVIHVTIPAIATILVAKSTVKDENGHYSISYKKQGGSEITIPIKEPLTFEQAMGIMEKYGE